MNNKVIILGTAHLKSTPGKCSPDHCFKEYIYSREVVKALKQRLDFLGYQCFIDWIDEDMSGCNQSKELCKRVQIVNDICNRYGKQNCIYISIHVNAAGCGSQWLKATGWSIYTSPGKTGADTLATCIYNQARQILEPYNKKIRVDFSDGDADFEENFYILKHTLCPAVLTENFFQDCKEDVEWLTSDSGRDAIIKLHLKGIIDYISMS